MKKHASILLIMLFTLSYSLCAQNFKVIVNNANPTSTLSKSEVSNYLLKKRSKWSHGTEVVPADLTAKSAIREAFSKDIHNKTTAQVRAFWQQSVFAGKDTPPIEMDSDGKMIDFIKSSPGSIGYISANANAQGVKVITIK